MTSSVGIEIVVAEVEAEAVVAEVEVEAEVGAEAERGVAPPKMEDLSLSPPEFVVVVGN